MVKEADADLVQACRRGNRRAFELLLGRYERPVFNVALRILDNPEDARDVTQTVFLKVYERLDGYDPTYKFFSWVYRIAVNEALHVLERRKPAGPTSEERPTERGGPEADLSRQQRAAGIQQALMSIKPEYRAVIVLRHFGDCSYCEIAQILGLPEKTVKSRLFTARQQLRDLLKQGEI